MVVLKVAVAVLKVAVAGGAGVFVRSVTSVVQDDTCLETRHARRSRWWTKIVANLRESGVFAVRSPRLWMRL